MRKINKIIVVALAAVMAFTSCKREDDPNPFSDDTKAGKEFTAGIQLNTCPISIDDEVAVGGGEGTSLEDALKDEKCIIGKDAQMVIMIKNGNEIIASGLFKVYNEKGDGINTIFKNLNVVLKHGYKYTVESTIVNDVNKQTDCSKNGIFHTLGNYQDAYKCIAPSEIDKWTSDDNKEFCYENLSNTSVDNKGIRYYYKGTYTAKYPATENEEINIPINLVCKSYKVSYQFANIPVDENHAIIASIGGNEMGREEGYTKDNFTTSTTVSEWYELRSMSSADETFGKITIALVNAKAEGPEFTEEDIYKIFEKTPKAGSKLTPGHHYTITTDFGIEAGVNITVDTYTLIEVDPIDMNAKETNEQ